METASSTASPRSSTTNTAELGPYGGDPVVGEHRWPVVLLPGGILPAGPAYQALLAELGDGVDARAKDLEMYAGSTVPPPGYSLETEVEGIRRVADDAGFESFHLVGYSAGGAS